MTDRPPDADNRIRAVCPSCRVVVLAVPAILTQRAQCPGCQKVVQFQRERSEGEELLDATKVAGRAAKATAGELSKASQAIGKAGAVGIGKLSSGLKKHVNRGKLKKALAHHLETDFPNAETLTGLEAQACALGLSITELSATLKKQRAVFLQRMTAALQTAGGCAQHHLDLATRYVQLFDLEGQFGGELRSIIDRQTTLERIKSGEVDAITNVTGLIVRSTELVWLQTAADMVEVKRTGDVDLHAGTLYVTNVRLVFTSKNTPYESQLSNINAVDIESGKVVVMGKNQSSTAMRRVSDPVMAAASIEHALRSHHRQVDVGFEQSSRSIPQDVKQAVWQRDGGQCVECGATDYLEYDHVVPFSKGGASTINNVQLLCRRCNLQKSDRI